MHVFSPALISASSSDVLNSYIPNLDRDFILALAKSALHYQVGAIRDALYKHIACKASMRVDIPVGADNLFDGDLQVQLTWSIAWRFSDLSIGILDPTVGLDRGVV